MDLLGASLAVFPRIVWRAALRSSRQTGNRTARHVPPQEQRRMFTRVFVRSPRTLWLAAAAFFSIGPSSGFAQDGNGSTTAAQPAPPAILPRTPGILTEPKVLVGAIDRVTDKFGGNGTGTKRSGFYPELSNMQT